MSWPKRFAARARARWFNPIHADLEARAASGAAEHAALAERIDRLERVSADLAHVRFGVASIQAHSARIASSLQEAAFKGYSQFGEDGAIQWLIAKVPIASKTFVEIGVGDYSESNTRFLLEHDNWSGRIIDLGADHIEFVRRSDLAWRRTVETKRAFVTAETVNELLVGMPEDLGLLSLDIDGVDYWVLSAISAVRPRIVVCEYNSLFGRTAAVTVPYDPGFARSAAHHSGLYFGASIAALEHWGRQRGYRLIGGTSEGVNAFLVRDDVADGVPSVGAEEAWKETLVRQARNETGELTSISGLLAQRALIRDLPLIDVRTGDSLSVGDLE